MPQLQIVYLFRVTADIMKREKAQSGASFTFHQLSWVMCSILTQKEKLPHQVSHNAAADISTPLVARL